LHSEENTIIFVTINNITMRRVFSLFITLLLISCDQNDSDSYSIEGNAFGYEDGTPVYLFEIDNNNNSNIMDTLVVKRGKFTGSYLKIDDTSLHFFRVGDSKGNILFFIENEDLKVTIYKDSLGSSFVTGGLQNELYTEYQSKIAQLARKRIETTDAYRTAQREQDGILIAELRKENIAISAEETAYKRKFVRENSNSIFGLMLLSELFSKQEMTSSEVTALINGLGPKLATHKLATELKTSLDAKKMSEIGGTAPQFSAPTPTGEMLSLQDVLGKYTIIDFWASWCRPCRKENPNVVNVYNKYHDKGLNIISVSLDKAGQKERWLKAIKDDKMDWYHVSNLRFWQDPIARQYNVRSIPATFLLDDKGNIIDKDLRGPALGAKIGSLLD